MQISFHSLKTKKILVTGGAGFIGSHICDALLNLGANVLCLDNLSTGKKENIKSALADPNFTFIQGDIRDYELCSRLIQDCDLVTHQAALGSVPRSLNDPITTNEVNISGFLNVLEACRKKEGCRLVYAASSSTYGDSEALPKIEEIIGNPLSPYAVTKYVNELYASVFSRSYGIETIGLRYFNVFGPRQDENGAYAAVIPKFISAIIKHQSPIINGDGTYSRDFTFVENVVQANLLALATPEKKALNTVYNIAYGERIDLNELVSMIKKNLQADDPIINSINPIYGEKRKGDVPHSLASIEKAKSLLGYKPQFNFESGLKHTIDWYLKPTQSGIFNN